MDLSIVATRVRVIGDGYRGDYVPPSVLAWAGSPLRSGAVGEPAVNKPARRADAFACNPEVIVAETDGAGVYAAARTERTD